MLSSDVENPPPQSDPNTVAVVVSFPPPGDGRGRRRSEHGEGTAAATVLPASDLPPPPPRNPKDNFSIREYVFRSRSKDIYANWPFSRKNLQLCLQHGVTEVLPPFQHLEATRCRSFEIPKFENRSIIGKDCVANFKSEPSSSQLKKVSSLLRSDRAAELNVDGAAFSEQLSSVRSSARDDVPVVATQVSEVTTEQVPTKTAIPPACLKSGSLAQTAGKKCRFIIKFGTRSSGDDTASNCASVSENMASKICPVCKTFSSSSNTTLNAHIDQCLSLESVPQRLSIRHRIKPRKTRLMADVYETALRCTIEELNRRNGLNWANSSSLPAPNADVASDEERRPSTPMARAGNNPGDDGAVYIDANGTKLRILSKFIDDPPESRSAKDVLSQKSPRGKKVSDMFKKKSKKLPGRKCYEYLKLASKGKTLASHKARESQKNLRGTLEGGEQSQGHTQSSVGPRKPGLSATVRQWSSSKRTSPKKKLAAKEGENLQTPARSCSPDLLGMSEDNDYSRSSESEKESSWSDWEQEQPMICETSLAWSDVMPDSVEKWYFPPAKRKLPKEDHLREVDVSNIKKDVGHVKSQLRQKKGSEIHVVAGGHASILGRMSRRQLRPRPTTTKALGISTLSKRALSLCQSSENSSDISAGQMELCFKKPKQHLTGSSHHMSEDPAQDRSVEEGADFEIYSSESSERETVSLHEVAQVSDAHGEVQYMKSTSNDVCDTEPSTDTLENCTWGLSKYYDPPHLDLSDCSGTHSCSQQFLGICKDSLCGVEDDFSRAYDAFDAVNEENADDGKDNEGYGAGQSSSFVEIDPIPIPGPPGSFLPSPGAMGSDDFQGNSSLTTSQAHSSHDQEYLVDGDASDSPISATSTVSNSADAKAGMDYSEELVSRGHPLLQEDTWAGFSSASNNGSPIQRDPSAEAAPSCSDLAETMGKANNVSIKKGLLFTRDVDEPCCCQKKERAVSQSIVLDYHQMEPPKMRRSPSEFTPGAVRQTNQIPSGGSQSARGYEVLIPKSAEPSNISLSRGFCEFPNGSGRADCDFPTPSSSNPVLRLMGKDLIVVNKDDNAGIANLSQSNAPAPVKMQDSQPVAVRSIPCDQDYCYKDTDYSPTGSFFTGSSSSYPGITMPAAVQAPKPVPVSMFINPKIASQFTVSVRPKYDDGLKSSIQFVAGKIKPVGPSKQMMTEVAPLIIPSKESDFASCIVNNMNLPRDAVILPGALPNASTGTSALPAVYQTQEPTTLHDPVAELAVSYPQGTVFINSKPGHNADGHLLQRTPPFVTAPAAFLGCQGSGYMYYPSYS